MSCRADWFCTKLFLGLLTLVASIVRYECAFRWMFVLRYCGAQRTIAFGFAFQAVGWRKYLAVFPQRGPVEGQEMVVLYDAQVAAALAEAARQDWRAAPRGSASQVPTAPQVSSVNNRLAQRHRQTFPAPVPFLLSRFGPQLMIFLPPPRALKNTSQASPSKC